MRLLVIAVLAGLAAAGPARANGEGDASAGHAIVAENCSRCHAVEPTGDSPNPAAPPMRTFASEWPLENLEEALAEGIVVGHEGIEMPEFVFEPEQISDIIAYLRVIGKN